MAPRESHCDDVSYHVITYIGHRRSLLLVFSIHYKLNNGLLNLNYFYFQVHLMAPLFPTLIRLYLVAKFVRKKKKKKNIC